MAKAKKARARVQAKRKAPAKLPRGRPTKLTQPVADRIAEGVSLGMTFKNAAMAGGVHEKTLEKWRTRGAREADSNSIYARFIGQLARAAEKTAIDYLEKIRQSIMESPVRVREHIKKDESSKVILTEIHRETLPPDIKGAMWWLERRFPRAVRPPRPDGACGRGQSARDADSRAQTHDRAGEIRRRSLPAHARRRRCGAPIHARRRDDGG